MDTLSVALSASTLTMLLFELAKFVVAKLTKKPDFNFEPIVFAVGVPVLNALMPFFLVYVLGVTVTDPILSYTVVGVLRYAVIVALQSVASFLGYDQGIKPLKEYAKAKAALKG